MSKNYDSSIEIGFCGSTPERREDKLPELKKVMDADLEEATELFQDDFRISQLAEYVRDRRQLLAALKENARRFEQVSGLAGRTMHAEQLLEKAEAALALRDEEIVRLECQLAEMKAEFIDQLHRDEQTQQNIKEVLGEK